MPLQGHRSETLDQPFNAKESYLKLLDMINELNSKLSKIIDEHEILKKQVETSKTADNLKESFLRKQVYSEKIHVTDTMKMLVRWYVERRDWEKLQKGLLELLPKTSKVYWQVQETCGNCEDFRVEQHIGERGHTELAVLLLDAGMPVDKTGDILCGAVADDRQELVQVLLDRGVDVNASDRRGDPPLHTASKSQHLKMVKLLLQAGADVNSTNYDGCTCLHVAAYYGYFDVVKCLVEAGANIALRDKENFTALNYASAYGKGNVVQFLSLLSH